MTSPSHKFRRHRIPGGMVPFSSVETKTLAGFLATLFLLMLAGGYAYRSAVDAAESTNWVNHTQLVRASLGRLYAAMSDAESQQCNYILSAKPEYLASFKSHANAASQLGLALVQLLADNPAQLRRVKELQVVVAERVVLLERTAATFEQSGLEATQELIRLGEGRELMNSIRALVKRLNSTEEELLVSLEAEAARNRAKILIFLLATIVVATAGFMVLFGGIRRELATRARTERNLMDFKAALDQHAIVAITDERGKITYANDNFCAISKYAREELLGQDHRLINSGHHAKEFMRELWKTISSGLVWKGDIKNRAKDGAFYWVDTTIVPFFNADGKPNQFVAIGSDISGRKQVEETLRRSRALFESLFTALPGHFLVLSPDLKIVAASDAYLKATMTRLNEILGRDIFEVFPDNPDDATANGTSNLRASLDRVRLTAVADTMSIQKYDIRDPDGVFEERFWSPINSPVLGVDRQLEYIIHRAEDVTDFVRQKSQPAGATAELSARMERMEAEIFQSAQTVQAAKRQLEAANKELEAFSYSVSHDLRAPLRHVHGYVEMLAKATEGQLAPKAARYLKTIGDASVEMGQLIDDLLAFSRVGRAEMQEQVVDLGRVLQDTLRGLEMATKDRNISWKLAPLPSVLGDPSMLRQVLSNLIGNAVKYTRARDPAEIEIGCAGLEDGLIILFVRDNGAGFDMRYAHKLFGVFQRLHRAEEFEGTGIGLATVQRILTRHGGRVWAEAEPEKGATFSFTLKPTTTMAPTLSNTPRIRP